MDRQQRHDIDTIRVILERGDDPALVRWLSSQFGALFKRLDNLDAHFTRLESSMKTVEEYVADIKAAQDETATHVDAIKQDVTDLLKAIADMPKGGLTQAQADALDTVVAAGRSIADSVKAVDAMSPVETPIPAPVDPNVPPVTPAPSGGGL